MVERKVRGLPIQTVPLTTSARVVAGGTRGNYGRKSVFKFEIGGNRTRNGGLRRRWRRVEPHGAAVTA